jgi:hypothetical protein
MSDNAKLPEVELSNSIQRVINDTDNERLRSMCSLLNTFNYAVQVQSGRKEWNPSDFRVFCIALCAMDQIGLHEQQTQSKLLHAVESEMSKNTPRLPGIGKIA